MDNLLTKDIVCFYHHPCLDGFGAMLAIKRYSEQFNLNVTYIPVDYPGKHDKDKLVELCSGKIVYIVDFCFDTKVDNELPSDYKHSLSITKALVDVAQLVYIFDHHKYSPLVFTALRELAESKTNFTLTHDIKHSGAWLTWKHIHGEVPRLIEHISDGDLWLFYEYDTKAILAYLSSVGFDEKVWELATHPLFDNEAHLDNFAKLGHQILVYQDQLVNSIASEARLFIHNDNYRIMVVDCPRMIRSIVGDKLLEDKDIDLAVTYNRLKDGQYRYSVRSRNDSKINAKTYCEQYGGGGHDNASGFVTNQLLFV